MIASSERKIWPLTGGVHPEENKHQSTGSPVSVPPLPKTLVLPLSQHAGEHLLIRLSALETKYSKVK